MNAPVMRRLRIALTHDSVKIFSDAEKIPPGLDEIFVCASMLEMGSAGFASLGNECPEGAEDVFSLVCNSDDDKIRNSIRIDAACISKELSGTQDRWIPHRAALIGGEIPERFFAKTLGLAKWRSVSKHCGKCGAPMTDARTELARGCIARECPVCGHVAYPKISPAVTVVVIDGDRILLAHNSSFPGKVYSCVAGFVEIGETLEECVAREVFEETGIETEDIRYSGSQAWPFPDSLMLGFTARRAGGLLKPDGTEIDDARFFGMEELPELPRPGSLSRRIIDGTVAGIVSRVRA